MGESAAILTSCLWTGSSLLFTTAGKKIGAFSVNTYRTTIAIALLVCAHVVFLGAVLPVASGAQWFWMGLSGIVGLGIGDLGLFAAYVAIGPRWTVLVQSSSPIFASAGAFLVFGETFSLLAMLGVAVTLTGILIVLLERDETSKEMRVPKERKRRGLFFALVSAMGQGFGVVLSKEGMYVGVGQAMNPVSAALIRMLLAGSFIWACAFFLRRLPELNEARRNREGIKYAAAGALVGPFAGMTLSMVAIANAEAGIAQTLMSLMPVFIIPVIWIAYREKTSKHGILGAVVAVLGVSILFIT
jgi:drug/metabolite transporter (DMT)-like permease